MKSSPIFVFLGIFFLVNSLAGKAADHHPIFLKQGASLLQLNFNDNNTPNDISAKQKSHWSVIDGVLVGIPASQEDQDSKKGHDGSNPIMGIDMPDQKGIFKADFMFEAPNLDGGTSIQFGHTISQVTFEDGSIMLECGPTGDREPVSLQSGKWYAIIAELIDDQLLVTIPGIRTFYIQHEHLKAEKKAFKFRGPKSSKTYVDNIEIYATDGIQDDWNKRKASALANVKTETLPWKGPAGHGKDKKKKKEK